MGPCSNESQCQTRQAREGQKFGRQTHPAPIYSCWNLSLLELLVYFQKHGELLMGPYSNESQCQNRKAVEWRTFGRQTHPVPNYSATSRATNTICDPVIQACQVGLIKTPSTSGRTQALQAVPTSGNPHKLRACQIKFRQAPTNSVTPQKLQAGPST